MKNNTSGMKLLCRLDELPDGEAVIRHIGRKGFLVVRTGDSVSAIGHECPHHGQSLETGLVRDGEITCQLHFARFDLRTGAVLSPPSFDGIASYATSIENGDVYVGRPVDVPMPVPNEGRRANDRVVIVGAGAAGASCAEELRVLGYGGRITLITRESHGPYDRTLLSKEYLAGTAEASWLPLRDPDYYRAIGIELITGVQVERINRSQRTVLCSDNEERGYEHLVVATGSRARRPRGLDAARVFAIRSLTDANELADALSGVTRMIIIGAGFVGLEAASSLAERGIASVIVAPEQTPYDALLGTEIGGHILQRHEKQGTEFRLGRFVRRIDEDGRRVNLDDSTNLEGDAILLSVGAVPETSLLSEAGLCANGLAVMVDERCRTADARIYAGGDIANAIYPALGVRMRSEHWTTAIAHGREIAASIAGSEHVRKEIPFFWSNQAGVTIRGIGVCSATMDYTVRTDGASGELLSGFFRDGRLLGAAGIGFHHPLMSIDYALRTGAELSIDDFLSF